MYLLIMLLCLKKKQINNKQNKLTRLVKELEHIINYKNLRL